MPLWSSIGVIGVIHPVNDDMWTHTNTHFKQHGPSTAELPFGLLNSKLTT